MKKLVAMLSSAVILFSLSAPSFAAEIRNFDKIQDGFVSIDEGYLNVREKPDAGSEVVGLAADGAIMHIISIDDNDWAHVRSGNIEGYVSASYVLRGKAADEVKDLVCIPIAVVSTYQAAIRADMSKDADVLSTAKEGDALAYLKTSDNGLWYEVKAPTGETGYILSSSANIESGFETAKPASYFDSETEETSGSYEASAQSEAEPQTDAEPETIALQEVDGKTTDPEGIIPYDSIYQN